MGMKMKATIEIDGDTLRELVVEHLRGRYRDLPFAAADILIQLKSKKGVWETAEYRALWEVNQ